MREKILKGKEDEGKKSSNKVNVFLLFGLTKKYKEKSYVHINLFFSVWK